MLRDSFFSSCSVSHASTRFHTPEANPGGGTRSGGHESVLAIIRSTSSSVRCRVLMQYLARAGLPPASSMRPAPGTAELSPYPRLHRVVRQSSQELSLIHISEPTRLGMISYAVFCV